METDLREEIVRLHAQICNGLADPSRILILYTLEEHPFSVSELADTLGLSQPTVSRHLKTLRDRGMVTAQRDGQSVYYHLADQRLIQALDLLRAVLKDTLLSRADLVRPSRSA
ncbi:MAG: metalloregulator ArsR/SmtB family transcription factor [Anaerolineales bacterium]|jgi:DNA-binding transcriptional ArsR family regulator